MRKQLGFVKSFKLKTAPYSEEESLLEDNESDQDARPRSRSLRGATSTVSFPS